ncbi:hypothetical protein KR054_012059 [Drosophila jambulina]|nr:hypothetical protein KR054_012059 [Drosophila jambulina]
MVHWVDLLLKGSYLYGHFIGVSNFELDWRTGRVFSTARSTLYAIVNNGIIVFLLVSFLHQGLDFDARLFNAHKLIESVVIIMTILRISAGLLTLLNRWRQRRQLMELTTKFIRLFLARPQAIRISRWGLLGKFLVAILTDFLQIAFSLDAIGRVDSTMFLGMALQFWISAILNLAIAQHFLVTLFIRANYQLLNTELRQVIKESQDLSYHRQHKGAFMTRCCYLADQLENIARHQNELQSVLTRLYEVFEMQGLMVYGGYYISTVTTTYLTYSSFKYGYAELGMTQRSLTLTLIWCLFYYLDAMINFFTTLSVQDGHREMIRLLEDRTLFANGLDVRLEQSFESFQLQLVRNPLKMDIMKLFNVSRGESLAMLGSLVTHSIILIQYDMENF